MLELYYNVRVYFVKEKAAHNIHNNRIGKRQINLHFQISIRAIFEYIGDSKSIFQRQMNKVKCII